MLKIQEELGLKETAFYKEAFEEGRQEGRLEGKQEGKLEGKQEGRLEGRQEGKLETVPLLRELGLSDEQIAEKLGLPLREVQRVPKQ